MSDKLQFQEKLRGILDLAKEQGMRLLKEDIEQYFEADGLSDQQMELVYDYLLAQKVVVRGYIQKSGSVAAADKETVQALSEDDKTYLKEYMQDIQGIVHVTDAEKYQLFEQAAAGDKIARSRLLELYLARVADIAAELKHPDVFIGDMIQEGNISLMLALDSLTAAEHAEAEIEAELRQGIQAVIAEQIDVVRRDNHMVKKVRDLDDKITEITEDMGRKVTIDELVLYTGLSEEEIRDIMKLTDDGEPEMEPSN